jgi:hypothetical protein
LIAAGGGNVDQRGGREFEDGQRGEGERRHDGLVRRLDDALHPT